MKKDINWMLIESVVRRTVQKLHDSPEREIRNLIDLGLSFADGRFQRKFLKASQKMLRNEKSAYYPLIKDVVSHVDEERLVTFGMNLGYNGCTRGAKTIRQIEHEESFNIPWALSFSLNIAQIENGCYSSVIRQGTELGIYVYLMEASDPVEQSLALTAEHPDCAFVLFVRPQQITDAFVQQLEKQNNLMLSVEWGEGALESCRLLREHRLLYSVHHQYSPEQVPALLDGSWLEQVLPAHPAFALLLAQHGCPNVQQQEVYQYVLSVRDGQKYPLILMDIKNDLLMIDNIISSDVCLAGFDRDGTLYSHNATYRTKDYNLFASPVRQILSLAMKKTDAPTNKNQKKLRSYQKANGQLTSALVCPSATSSEIPIRQRLISRTNLLAGIQSLSTSQRLMAQTSASA